VPSCSLGSRLPAILCRYVTLVRNNSRSLLSENSVETATVGEVNACNFKNDADVSGVTSRRLPMSATNHGRNIVLPNSVQVVQVLLAVLSLAIGHMILEIYCGVKLLYTNHELGQSTGLLKVRGLSNNISSH
jgi:hypothetical protein